MQANSGSSTESHRYYICSDLIDLDDNQEEQVSLYKTSVESSTYLTPAEALAYAEKQGAENWSILAFGGGDSKRIDKHHIEYSGIVDGVQNSWVIEEFDSSNSIAINS